MKLVRKITWSVVDSVDFFPVSQVERMSVTMYVITA